MQGYNLLHTDVLMNFFPHEYIFSNDVKKENSFQLDLQFTQAYLSK